MSKPPDNTLSLLRAGKLAGSVRLDLCCGLAEFPREIFELSDSLEILNLSGNQLSELPADLSRLRKLRILFCSDNQFRHLPAVLGECASLTMVGFKANRIETVDDGAFPESLQWLILTDNRIQKLPGTIGGCAGLQKLMLAGNMLEDLPDEMAACWNLELVRLAANRFHAFPSWLFELPRLSWLGLGGNPWSDRATVDMPSMEEIDWADLTFGDQLGEGASGTIHHAHWRTELESRSVAVKIFKGEMTSDGLPHTEMTACLAAERHEHLIEVLGKISNHPDERCALVMSLIDPGFSALAGPPDFESCTRDVYSEDRSFTPAAVMRMALGLSSVGRHLHERRILHGDFYAHNILWSGAGDFLLGDFGAACVYPGDDRLERIEVRAFGILLGELLERCAAGKDDADVMDRLQNLQRRCVTEVAAERPQFARIVDELHGALSAL
ncbi:MAG: leucine-rich repeat-containing protein kinase family protein [Luteolibacter sp.]|uniref:leucine-rich repeat-containing protein kinase family protein n=1 Tax=Luteolibacter sp. TaxID=1962973 RepID=UPI00326413FE